LFSREGPILIWHDYIPEIGIKIARSAPSWINPTMSFFLFLGYSKNSNFDALASRFGNDWGTMGEKMKSQRLK
jgi:hypothetical protein